MIERTRSLFHSLLVFVNICVIAAYLSVCLVPFINTGKYWFFGFPGLVFPLIFFALLCFIILWAFDRSGWFWISLVAMLLGIQQIASVFAFHFPQKMAEVKPPNTLRVLQWNVSSWDEINRKSKGEKGGATYRDAMLDLVKRQDADILCFEEFFESEDTAYFSPNISAITAMGYPYHFFVPSESYERDYQSGIIIFSKYQMTDSAKFSFDRESTGEHLLYADVKVEDNIFRIFATHLQSVHFERSDYESLSRLKKVKNPGLRHSKNIISKLKFGYSFRYEQASLVQRKIAESPYPAIVCGDFNDVPNSSTYFKIKGNLQDAFLKKGSWIGRTFRFISPTLRIDYLLCDKQFKVNRFQTIHVPYSDHYPVETDLQY